MMSPASLLGLALFVWTVPVYGSLAAQKPADRIEFGAVAEAGGIQGRRLTSADGLNVRALPPTPWAITVRGLQELRRRADDPDELVRSIHRMVSQAETGAGLGSNERDSVRGLCDSLGRQCDALSAGADQRKVQGACATLRKKCAELQAGPASPPPSQGQGLGPASGVPNGAGRDSTNRLSAGARMGRDMALGVGVVVLLGLFTM